MHCTWQGYGCGRAQKICTVAFQPECGGLLSDLQMKVLDLYLFVPSNVTAAVGCHDSCSTTSDCGAGGVSYTAAAALLAYASNILKTCLAKPPLIFWLHACAYMKVYVCWCVSLFVCESASVCVCACLRVCVRG